MAKDKLTPKQRKAIKKVMLDVADAAIAKRDHPGKIASNTDLVAEIERSQKGKTN